MMLRSVGTATAAGDATGGDATSSQVHLCWPGPHLRWPRSPASLLATTFLATTGC